MKVLFYSAFMYNPHFETELELIQEYLMKGDEVFVVHCKGELNTCFRNPEHDKYVCVLCKSMFERGIDLLPVKERIHLIEFPLSQQKYAEIPLVFQTIDQLKEFKIGNVELGVAAASSLITSLNREHRLDTIKHKDRVLKEVNNAYYVYLFFKKILDDVQPDVVYVFNGRFSTILPAINACEEQNVNYITHERGGILNKYYLVSNSTVHDLEYAHKEMEQLWQRSDEKERVITGNKFFIDRKNRVEHAWYSFTKEQKQNLLPSGFDPTKKNIGIFNTSIEEYAAVRDWKYPIPVYNEEIVAFNKIFQALENDHDIHIYLRIHPNLKGFDNSQIREIKSLESKYMNVTIILPESTVDSYALMENCDTIITFGSTMGVEACYWGKPSILLGMSYYQKLDCCYSPRNHEETIELIRADLAPKDKSGALKYGFWELSKGVNFKYFKQLSLTSGLFLGKKVTNSDFAFVKALFYYLFSKKIRKDFLRFINSSWNSLSKG